MKTYPECEKMAAVQDKSQTIGEFLDWLGTKYTLAEYDEYDEDELFPVSINIQKLLAEYFEIDLDKVEEEKNDILNEMRKLNAPVEQKKKTR